MTVVMIMVVVVIVVVAFEKLRLELEDAVEIEGVAAQHLARAEFARAASCAAWHKG